MPDSPKVTLARWVWLDYEGRSRYILDGLEPPGDDALVVEDLTDWGEILDDLAYKDELEHKEPSADMRRLAARLHRAINNVIPED